MTRFIKNSNPFIYSFIIAFAVFLLSCNKAVEQFPEIQPADTSSAPGLAATIAADANYSLYSAVISKAGLADTLNNKKATYTMFVPANAAVKSAINLLSGGLVPVNAPDAAFVGFIQSNLPVETAKGVVKYNTVPNIIDYANLSTNFPNLQYPTILNPAPALSAILRLTTFPSKNNNINYVNNIPVTSAKADAGNGSYYSTAALVLPPTASIMDRINADAELTYIKAAVARSDSGLTTADLADPRKSTVALLSSIGTNLTVFAPTDPVFRMTLIGLITRKLVDSGVPLAIAQAQATALAGTPNVFNNPALSSVLTPANVKGILVYHILNGRAFSNNFQNKEADYPTLLSAAIAGAPLLRITPTFTGPFVSALKVKGNINPTAANVIINPLPNGSSDQHYTNGVLHKINQVLLPLNL